MRFTLVYSEQQFDGKPPKRYTLKNLTLDNVKSVVEILRVPIPGLLIKFIVYDSSNAIYAVGDNKEAL